MAYVVEVKREPMAAVLDLKGRGTTVAAVLARLGASLPDRPMTTARGPDLAVHWIGKDHWLLTAPIAEEARIAVVAEEEAERMRAGGASAVLLSDAYAFFSIRGRDAGAIVAIASPLDVHSRAFPEEGAALTEAFGLPALVVRRPDGFDLAVERSYANMIADYLARATTGTGGISHP
ncbi:MAG: sarcosine oxidase subunit gamma [Rhizobiales bacterium]|nr:sarcosine oxidase subunit gamma [Hyphomicrobiales bacterium]